MFHWNRRRIRNGSPELRALGREARAYIKEHHVPTVSYCIWPFSPAPAEEPENPQIKYNIKETVSCDHSVRPADKLLQEARRDPDLYDSIEMARSYHEWEKKNSVRKSFSSEVLRRLDESGTPYVDFYKRAWLDKKMFYKIKSDYGYKPSMETAVKCCFGLRLNMEESAGLLQLAGYCFSPSSSRDLALKFCIEHNIHDLREVNYLLSGLGERAME